MARDESNVRVRLDTSRAKGELRGLVKDSERAAGRVSGSVRGAISRGFGLVGAGAAIGTGLSAVRGATESGIGDVVGEAFGGIGHRIAEFLLGDLNEKAKATRAAREETIQAFGAIAGHTGSIPPGAKTFFDQVAALREEQEKGRELFQGDERFRGPGIDQFLKRIVDALTGLLSDAVSELASRLNPFR